MDMDNDCDNDGSLMNSTIGGKAKQLYKNHLQKRISENIKYATNNEDMWVCV